MAEFITNNLFMVAIAVVSGSMLLYQLFRGGDGQGVTPQQATELINREHARVIDVRGSEDFEKGHINNSSNVPLEHFNQRIGELDKFKERVIIVYCRSGNSAKSACSALRKAGFAKVYNLAGGAAAWEQAGLPLTRKGKK